MQLEDEIKQKKFNSDLHKVLLNVLYTSSVIEGNNVKMMKPYGISPQQFNVLRILRGQGTNVASIGLLQERMLDKMSNASRLVDKLFQKGFVNRKISVDDRRQAEVLITEQGLDLLKKLDEEMPKFEKKFKNLSKEESKLLNNLLDKLRG